MHAKQYKVVEFSFFVMQLFLLKDIIIDNFALIRTLNKSLDSEPFQQIMPFLILCPITLSENKQRTNESY